MTMSDEDGRFEARLWRLMKLYFTCESLQNFKVFDICKNLLSSNKITYKVAFVLNFFISKNLLIYMRARNIEGKSFTNT